MISNISVKSNNWSCWSLAGCDPVASLRKILVLGNFNSLKTPLSDDQYLQDRAGIKLCTRTEAEDA